MTDLPSELNNLPPEDAGTVIVSAGNVAVQDEMQTDGLRPPFQR